MTRSAIAAALAALFLASVAAAQVPPSSLRLQGYLTDRTVVPAEPANGSYLMAFRLWDQATGGSQIAEEIVPAVDVVDGLYEVDLPFGPAQFEGPRWLEIVVDSEVLMPRLAIGSSPFAYLAGRAQVATAVDADGVDTDAIQDGAVSPDKLALTCAVGQVLARTAAGWDCLTLPECPEGVTRACYTGPAGTQGVGLCAPGTETCEASGMFGACVGETTPATEVCNGQDDDCDGDVDEDAGGSTWYLDADGDGFGEPGSGVVACSPPAGTVSNDLDCYDANPNARPGQNGWFAVHRGDGSFDYDCDGSEQRQWPAPFFCSGNCDSFAPGWTASVPPCGNTAQYAQACDTVFPSGCEADSVTPRTQACR